VSLQGFFTTGLLVGLVGGALPHTPCGEARAVNPPPTPADQDRKAKMDITPYKLGDDAFWASTERGADRLATDLLGTYRGLLVDAPRRVPIDRRHTLPGAVYHLGPIREVSVLTFEKWGLMTAMNVTDNHLYVATGRSFNPDSDPVAAEPVNAADLPDGDMSAVASLELREGLHLPWQPSRYLLTALLRNQVSNRAEVELCWSAACDVDPEATKHLGTEPAKLNLGEIFPRPGERLPSYHRQPDSPPVPAQGIEMSATRVSDQRLGQPMIVRGSFRLAPIASEWVKPGWADPSIQVRSNEPRPVAVVTVWLLVTGVDDGSVSVFPLRVPSWQREGNTCTGHFALDVRQLRGGPAQLQTYFIFAFSGEHLVGPVPTVLVGTR